MFFWLVLRSRIWTAERRKRHRLQDDDSCVFCAQAVETASHLFLGCVFSRQVWFNLFNRLGLDALLPTCEVDVAVFWTEQRRRIDKASRPIFDSLLLLVSWSLWKQRNARVFRGAARSELQVLDDILEEGEAWALAGYAPLAALSSLLSQN